MNYELTINGSKYNVDVDPHGYRKRFYAEKLGQNGMVIERLGYIGSYFPGSHTAGFQFSYGPMAGSKFDSPARGPKTAAKICLNAFLMTQNMMEAM
jgi:hypothetical protein